MFRHDCSRALDWRILSTCSNCLAWQLTAPIEAGKVGHGARGKGCFGPIYSEVQRLGLLLTRQGTGGAGSAHNPARVCFMTGWPPLALHVPFLTGVPQLGGMQEIAQTATE